MRNKEAETPEGAPAELEASARYLFTVNLQLFDWSPERLGPWENSGADALISHPLGEEAVGYITYTRDGYVFVAIMRPGRAKFAAGDLL